jgi:hypothetical protein
MIRNLILLAAIPAAVAPALAEAAPVQLASTVFVERFVPGPGGRTSRVLERADTLKRGDQVVFVVNWRGDAAREFTVTNPMPRSVSFQKSSDGSEDVSVDGGRTWGKLDTLRVFDDGRWRNAVPEDVTHVRWRVPTQTAARGSGQILYRGVVR